MYLICPSRPIPNASISEKEYIQIGDGFDTLMIEKTRLDIYYEQISNRGGKPTLVYASEVVARDSFHPGACLRGVDV